MLLGLASRAVYGRSDRVQAVGNPPSLFEQEFPTVRGKYRVHHGFANEPYHHYDSQQGKNNTS